MKLCLNSPPPKSNNKFRLLCFDKKFQITRALLTLVAVVSAKVISARSEIFCQNKADDVGPSVRQHQLEAVCFSVFLLFDIEKQSWLFDFRKKWRKYTVFKEKKEETRDAMSYPLSIWMETRSLDRSFHLRWYLMRPLRSICIQANPRASELPADPAATRWWKSRQKVRTKARVWRWKILSNHCVKVL